MGDISGEPGPELFVPEVAGSILPNLTGDERRLRAVKFVDGSDSLIEGLAIPFGGPMKGGKDLDGERFVPDTDLHLEWFPNEGRPFLIGHGLDPEIKSEVVGRQTERTPMEAGQWVRVQLDKRGRYFEHVQQLVDADGLSFSSGAVPHLVQIGRDGTIKSWPWVELSGTPTPSNPDAAAYAVKATDMVDHFAAAGLTLPAELIASALKALDAASLDDHSLLSGEEFIARLDRFVVDAPGWVEARRLWSAKSGRGLASATRERWADHPAALRQLADNLDALLATDAPTPAKADAGLLHDVAETLRRAALIDLPERVTV